MKSSLPSGGLALLILLGGCATTTQAPAPVASAEPTARAEAPATPASAPLAAVIPSGDLQPIKTVEPDSRKVALLVPHADLWERSRRGFKM